MFNLNFNHHSGQKIKFINITVAVMVVLLLFCINILPNPNVLEKVIAARAPWRATSLIESDASYMGEALCDLSGWSAAIAEDVNHDGYDDIIIGAPGNNDAGINAGKIYIIFGKSSGWFNRTSLYHADTYFIGENENDFSGWSVSGVGDINRDGYNDIVIGAPRNDYGGTDAGKTYLIFGKNTGWQKPTNLPETSASFVGENPFEHSGEVVSGGGDVNGDGYDDILIGASGTDDTLTSKGKALLIFGKKSGWSKNCSLSDAGALFVGESFNDRSGYSVAIADDVNGDGYDDILVGAPNSSNLAGSTYLFFGSSSGWPSHNYLADADVIFYGENSLDRSGISVSGTGDVNNDGFDDILIGAKDNCDGGKNAGKTYLIFGKNSGWSKANSLSETSASFIGEAVNSFSGAAVGRAGDVNGDGFDDILIGAPGNAGRTYLVLGKAHYGGQSINLSTADMSFTGEVDDDHSGALVSGGNDVNGDGLDDILIGAWANVGTEGQDTGQTYLIFPGRNAKPLNVDYVKLYKDPTCQHEASYGGFGELTYVELKGTDGNSSSIDVAEVKVYSNITDVYGITIRLIETENNSGVYRGTFWINNVTHESHSWIGVSGREKIVVKSIEYPLRYDSIIVNNQPIILQKPFENIEVIEDQLYQQTFSYTDYEGDAITWYFDTNATWLNFGQINSTVYGTPENDDVGVYRVKVKVVDCYGGYDELIYSVVVQNVNDAPELIKVGNKFLINDTIQFYAIEDIKLNITIIAQDPDANDQLHIISDNKEFYIVQVQNTEWNLSFLPTNDDVGMVALNIQIWDDGKPALSDTVQIIVTVNNTNDPPQMPLILEPLPNRTFEAINIINFSGFCSDPDLDIPNSTEVLGYTWYSDLEGEIGIGKNLNTSLSAGLHNITLTVRDECGCSSQSNICLKITSPDLTRPSLSLTSPLNEIIINNTSVELSWTPEHYEFGELSYDIFLDTSSPPSIKVARNFNGTIYTIENLTNGVTYYWTVIPKYRGHKGVSSNGIWNFSVNTSFIPVYDILIWSELTDNKITITQGQNVAINIWVFNTGNNIDSIELEYTSKYLENYITLIPARMVIYCESYTTVILYIEIPDGFRLGNYSINITAKSIMAMKDNNVNLVDDINISVLVEEKVEAEQISPDLLIISIILISILLPIMIIAILLLYKKIASQKK